MRVELFETGYFYADGGAMFGAIPKTAWQRRYLSNDQNGCVLAMRSLLIRMDDGRNILIDTGVGNKFPDKLSYYNFFDLKDITVCLKEKGIGPEEITDVVLTHLHFDHCGGCTRINADNGDIELVFPNAIHWVGDKQWQNYIDPHPLERESFFEDDMLPVMKSGKLNLLEKDTDIHPFLRLSLYDGHTVGMIVPFVQRKEQLIVFAGDLIPLAANLSLSWISAYDLQPIRSYDEKLRMLKKIVEKDHLLIFCHDAYTSCASIKKVHNYYKVDESKDL